MGNFLFFCGVKFCSQGLLGYLPLRRLGAVVADPIREYFARIQVAIMVVLMLRVIIADDHPIVRIGQKVVIEANGRCKVVAEADGPDQLLALVDSTPCDILVTDFAMPGNQQADGYGLLGLMRRRHPDLPVILVTMFANVATLRESFAQGARAILAKARRPANCPWRLPPSVKGAPSSASVCAHNWRRPGRAISKPCRSCPAKSAKWCGCSPAA